MNIEVVGTEKTEKVAQALAEKISAELSEPVTVVTDADIKRCLDCGLPAMRVLGPTSVLCSECGDDTDYPEYH